MEEVLIGGGDPSRLEKLKRSLELIKTVSKESQVQEYIQTAIDDLDEIIKAEEF